MKNSVLKVQLLSEKNCSEKAASNIKKLNNDYFQSLY